MIPEGPIKRDANRSLELRKSISRQKLDLSKTNLDERFVIAAALHELTSEHHSSVMLMILYRRFCSAQALLRPCVEAGLRTLWVAQCAPLAAVEEVKNSDRWPDLEQVIGKIEGHYRKGGFIRSLLPPRKLLNDLAHGGSVQIANRLMPAYAKVSEKHLSVEKMNELTSSVSIKTSDKALCLSAIGVHLACGNSEAANSVFQHYQETQKTYETSSSLTTVSA